ncbi:ABC transporter substrate-binding protein [Candidatus Poribacteria bacterium]|nr:ABC transporter substrate-binding protein [Candidatus Poribacteria bacterium]MBT5531821.1 ABC transporter substrate-binding protein [Candidatus Poribacteria bacterium]MBT7807968.1 ABC transporter substrate-binding protein [Candidatus Poribacteria bacterium]
MTTHRARARLLLLALSALLAAGARAQQQQGGGFSYGEVMTSQSSYDPIHRGSAVARRVGIMLYNSLIAFDRDGEPIPHLIDMTAERLRSYAPLNGVEYEFAIRDDVRWHDGPATVPGPNGRPVANPWRAGRPVSPYDVLFTYLAMKNNATAKSSVEFIARVRVLDDTHVRIVLRQPILRAFGRMAFPLIPHYPFVPNPLEIRADNPACVVPPTHAYVGHPVGTGPFRVGVQNLMNLNELGLEANDRYPILPSPRTRAYVDSVRLLLKPNEATLANDFGYGSINMVVALPRRYAEPVRKASPVPINEDRYPSTSYYYLAFNHRHPFLGGPVNREVRQAINIGMNRAQLRTTVEGGEGDGELSHGPFPYDSPYIDTGIEPYLYDVAVARKLLADAGFRPGSNRVLEKDGRRFTLTLVQKGSPVHSTIGEAFVADMRTLGIEVRVETAGSQDAWDQRVWYEHDFDIALGRWSFGLGGGLYPLFHSTQSRPGSKNYGSYENRLIDQMLEFAREQTDPVKHRNLMLMLDGALHEEAPYVFLWTPIRTAMWHSRIRGVDLHPSGFFNYVTDWWVDMTAGQAAR